ncbi:MULTISPECIES: FadR/GntR family transcriptional regulator [Cryobacterium]|uniref:FadR/GntR family transcriptional regulator n=1 Tax=Cryobacterium TaxID=69578 RepID=UPI001F541037|nr:MULTISPECIES: FCD domain-containing protein [Cryobacterium]MEB0203072.1 FCD domain-containing protein [Cryobacterium sp. 5I3]MEB0285433.1 FCD domain-containing protein [Cryobacterium sp. 10S3]WPX13318.1 FCD domain-containing protein [Cryobacterium sp. 10S3]
MTVDAVPAQGALPDERRAWQLVLESIEGELLSGRLRPGDRLAPERSLAASLGVGRSSVREAIRVLEVLGLIRTATGSGPTSGAIIVALPGGGMSALMRLQVAAQGFPVEDVVKTRLVLEAAVVTELAEAHDPASLEPASLEPAEQLLDAMDAPGRTESEFLALDAQFHLALAEATGNQVITATMAGLRSAIEAYARAGVAALGSWAETSARLRLEHREIVACIRAADPAAARRAVQAHIAGYYAETRLTAGPRDPDPVRAPLPSRADLT